MTTLIKVLKDTQLFRLITTPPKVIKDIYLVNNF